MCACARTAVQRSVKQAEEKAVLTEKLIAFCMDHWDNEFVLERQDELRGQRAMLRGD
jgi:hypothetical protein